MSSPTHMTAPGACASPQVLVVDGSQLFAEALARSLRRAGMDARAGDTVDDPGDCSGTAVILLDGDRDVKQIGAAAAVLRCAAPAAEFVLLVKATHRNPERALRAAGAARWVHRQSPMAELVRTLRLVLSGSGPAARSTPRALSTAPELTNLTAREIEVLKLIAGGRQNDAVAELLGISANTVRTHVQSILSKLDVPSRLSAVTMAYRAGIVATPTFADTAIE